MRTIWKSAGVRATREEVSQIETRRRRAVNENAQRAAEDRTVLESGWRRGTIRPYLITRALDLIGAEGPDVDTACLAQEPDVDNWEAGTLYPTLDQLISLAAYTGFPESFFVAETPELRTPSMFLCARGSRQKSGYIPEQLLTYRFTPEAIRARGMF